MPRLLPRLPIRPGPRIRRSPYAAMIQRIESCGGKLASLADEPLTKASLALRYRARSGEPLEQLLPEAFALVRETASRALNLRHYDVQLLAGVALHHGHVVVMQTGEGKTLTATTTLYLNALRGRGTHLITANDYLASRDAELMGPLFERLGLSVGTVTSETLPAARRQAYACDVTYTTAKEIGFDFLRDRLWRRRQELGLTSRFAFLSGSGQDQADSGEVLRELNFALIDEADNILIDEARTPLVVSQTGPEGMGGRRPLFEWGARNSAALTEGDHFSLDVTQRKITLTAEGRALIRRLAHDDSLASFPLMDIYEQMELALLVDRYYVRDRHYILRDGEVIIVDEYTGRLAEGRKWRAGLHQAIEAREQVAVTGETMEAARITLQDLFLRYQTLAGMTGTIGNSGEELKSIYSTPVMEIPTHRPPQRTAWPDRVFGTEREKWLAIADEVAELHKVGRPVLVGTRSIDKSQHLSALLAERGITHRVLNAKEHEREAEIVAHAGGFRRVTVATNMAGRGTDIQLDTPARELGGMHVICSELHESARIDRQLIGRCGRQGDPGSYRSFMSLEDELLEQGLPARRLSGLRRLACQSPRQLDRLSSVFRTAQRSLERRNFQGRKMLMHQEQMRQEMLTEMGLDPYLDGSTS